MKIKASWGPLKVWEPQEVSAVPPPTLSGPGCIHQDHKIVQQKNLASLYLGIFHFCHNFACSCLVLQPRKPTWYTRQFSDHEMVGFGKETSQYNIVRIPPAPLCRGYR